MVFTREDSLKIYVYPLSELRDLSLSQLNELFLELEVLIREFSETLISELALRDELEYEKELKNTFISLLLAVQNKRRQYHVEKKRNAKNSTLKTPSGLDPKVLNYIGLRCSYYLIFAIEIHFFLLVFNYCNSIPHRQWPTR